MKKVKSRYAPPELVSYGTLEAVTGTIYNCPSGGDLLKPSGGIDDTLSQQATQDCR